jgi:hypothetical protein
LGVLEGSAKYERLVQLNSYLDGVIRFDDEDHTIRNVAIGGALTAGGGLAGANAAHVMHAWTLGHNLNPQGSFFDKVKAGHNFLVKAAEKAGTDLGKKL